LEVDGGHHAGAPGRVLRVRPYEGLVSAVPRDRAEDIVVGEGPGDRRAGAADVRATAVDRLADGLGQPRLGQQVEVERLWQLVPAQVPRECGRVAYPHLADEGEVAALVGVGYAPPA